MLWWPKCGSRGREQRRCSAAHLLIRLLPNRSHCADVKLFEDQGNSDAILDDLACMLGCTRSSLHGKRSAVLKQQCSRRGE